MDVDMALSMLRNNPEASLDRAELVLELARDEYPDLDVEAHLSELAGMAHEAKSYLRGNLLARVTGLCRYLFHDQGFRGNQQAFYDPRNSYFNQVLERRTGIPITLSLVVMEVGRRAGLCVEGVGLPGHFVVKAVRDGEEVLFDPFHGGRLLSEEQCEQLVARTTGNPFLADEHAFDAIPFSILLARMLNNLKGAYLREGDFHRAVRVIKRLLQLHPNDFLQQRDLGISLVHSGNPGMAIDHLVSFLKGKTQGEEAEALKKILLLAQGEVAKWN
jgi:regulator of sirC expression with transglutaminase-like and TPR domain